MKSIIPKGNIYESSWPHTYLHLLLSSVFTWTILHQVFFLSSKCYWILMHASLKDFFFICLLAAVPTLTSYLSFFSHSEGGHDLITIQHKLKDRITRLFIYFGIGFFFFPPCFIHGSRSSLGSFVSFARCKRREREEKMSGPARRWLHYFGCWSSKCRRLWAVAALAAQSACYTRCSAKSICTHTHTIWKCAEFGRRKKNTHLMLVWWCHISPYNRNAVFVVEHL